MHSPIPHIPTTRTSSGVVEETHAKIFDPLNIASLCEDPHNSCKNVSEFVERNLHVKDAPGHREMRRSSGEIKKLKAVMSLSCSHSPTAS